MWWRFDGTWEVHPAKYIFHVIDLDFWIAFCLISACRLRFPGTQISSRSSFISLHFHWSKSICQSTLLHLNIQSPGRVLLSGVTRMDCSCHASSCQTNFQALLRVNGLLVICALSYMANNKHQKLLWSHWHLQLSSKWSWYSLSCQVHHYCGRLTTTLLWFRFPNTVFSPVQLCFFPWHCLHLEKYQFATRGLAWNKM